MTGKSSEVTARKFQTSDWNYSPGFVKSMERLLQVALAAVSAVPILITLAIAGVLLFEAFHFFQEFSLTRFLTDTQWTAPYNQESLGIVVLLWATILVSGIAMAIAVPVGLLAAIYLAEYAPSKVRWFLKPVLESLVGVPTVVLGYFGFTVLTPFLKGFFPDIAAFNALSGGIITGLMLVPIISSLSESALRSVPDTLREAAYSLGLTRVETIVKIVLPAAFPSIMAAIALALSRAMGETMIAVLASGQVPTITFNPLDAVETMSAFILLGSLAGAEFSSIEFQTIFTVGLALFILTLSLNTLGNWLVRLDLSTKNDLASIKVATTVEAPIETMVEAQRSEPAIERFAGLPPRESGFHRNSSSRDLWNRIFHVLSAIATLIGCIFLACVLYNSISLGWSSLSWRFLTSMPSTNVDEAGIWAGLVGTVWLLVLTGLIAVPMGIAAAVFLQEYLPDNRLFQILEVNIANMAAVPTILYGLLGLELFVRVAQPVTGGRTILSGALTLSAIILPFIIIGTRTALREVPNSLRRAGYAIGMSRWQVIWYVVLPAALPGVTTSMLIALGSSVGETPALIAIGALAFISFTPPLSLEGLSSEFMTLPVQIYNWASQPDPAFQSNAAAAIVVLLLLLLLVNGTAAFLRNRTIHPKG